MYSNITNFFSIIEQVLFGQELIVDKPKIKGPINDLPDDPIVEIFSYLGLVDLCRASNTCRSWKQVEEKSQLLNRYVYNTIAFGKTQWIKYYGKGVVENDQEDLKALPKDIFKILLTQLPDSRERVLDSQILVWIPKQINGKYLTIKTFLEIVSPNCFKSYVYLNYPNDNENSVEKSHWVLMSKDVLASSKGKSFEKLKVLVKEFSEKTKIAYEMPNLLDVIVCIFAEYVRSDNQTRLFSGSHSTGFFSRSGAFTICQERSGEYQSTVGDSYSHGLSIKDDRSDKDITGVAAFKKFF